MSIRRNVLVFAAVCGLAACTDPPPPGGDLVLVHLQLQRHLRGKLRVRPWRDLH